MTRSMLNGENIYEMMDMLFTNVFQKQDFVNVGLICAVYYTAMFVIAYSFEYCFQSKSQQNIRFT